MYQFIISIIFEVVLIIVFAIGFLLMNGNISMYLGAGEFESWRRRNGVVIKYICLVTILMLIASIVFKYQQLYVTPPQTLPTGV